MAIRSAEELDGVAFIGTTLGPFFLNDPQKGDLADGFEAFRALDAQAVASQWPFIDALPEADRQEFAAALQTMVGALADGISDDLTWEYRRLFVGPGHKPVPPWGSVYTDFESVVFGASTLELRSWMRANGIERLGDADDPEDHIGLMLLMIAWITQNKPACLDEFLTRHLLTWSSHYLELLGREAAHGFYAGLARVTQLSLEGIQVQFGLEVVYPHYFK